MNNCRVILLSKYWLLNEYFQPGNWFINSNVISWASIDGHRNYQQMSYFFEPWFYWKGTENKYITYVDIKLSETG